jgi:hypothetical protein
VEGDPLIGGEHILVEEAADGAKGIRLAPTEDLIPVKMEVAPFGPLLALAKPGLAPGKEKNPPRGGLETEDPLVQEVPPGFIREFLVLVFQGELRSEGILQERVIGLVLLVQAAEGRLENPEIWVAVPGEGEKDGERLAVVDGLDVGMPFVPQGGQEAGMEILREAKPLDGGSLFVRLCAEGKEPLREVGQLAVGRLLPVLVLLALPALEDHLEIALEERLEVVAGVELRVLDAG